MKHGDLLRYGFPPPAGRRPVVVLTRSSAIGNLNAVVVAPVSATIRNIPSEVVLDESDGLAQRSFANLDNLQTMAKSRQRNRPRSGAPPVPWPIRAARGAVAADAGLGRRTRRRSRCRRRRPLHGRRDGRGVRGCNEGLPGLEGRLRSFERVRRSVGGEREGGSGRSGRAPERKCVLDAARDGCTQSSVGWRRLPRVPITGAGDPPGPRRTRSGRRRAASRPT